MNIIDFCSDSIIKEIIDIFKELYMEIKIVNVETVDDKWGLRKVLTDDKGNKYKVTAKQKFYEHVHGAGIYDIRFGEFKGKQYVQWATLVSPLGGNDTKPAEKSQEGAILSDKMAFEKAKQNDILVEFYARLAFDMLMARKKADEIITPGMIMLEAGRLVRLHKSTVVSYELDEENIQAETFDKATEDSGDDKPKQDAPDYDAPF